MPLPKQYHTSKDYWNLPEGQRAELIDGTLCEYGPAQLSASISDR